MSLIKLNRSLLQLFNRQFSISNSIFNDKMPVKSDGELKLINMLKERFSGAKLVEVTDISGGCGSMYAVYVETLEFKNLRKIKQHQMVTEVLKSEITNNMHGINTKLYFKKIILEMV